MLGEVVVGPDGDIARVPDWDDLVRSRRTRQRPRGLTAARPGLARRRPSSVT
jgi:hypothetical protein